jgi:hypothetical protein
LRQQISYDILLYFIFKNLKPNIGLTGGL